MRKFFNRVRHTTATNGQGTVTLGAAFSTRFMTFAEAGAVNNDEVVYVIEEGNDFEVGKGIYTSGGPSLTRATIYSSKIGGTAGASKMVLAGTATVRGIFSANDINEALYSRGPVVDVPSGPVTSIGAAESQNVRITGTTSITSFGSADAGVYRRGYFSGILVLTHNATSMVLPGNANITTTVNDRFGALSLGSDNWIVLFYERATGKSLIPVGADEITSGTLSRARLSGGVAFLDTEDQIVSGGATVTSKVLNGGNPVTTGTVTLDAGDRSLQSYTNGGAHTLAPGVVAGAFYLDITNNISAGAITTTGWTKVVGSFTITNGHKFRCACSIGDVGSLLQIQAMQ